MAVSECTPTWLQRVQEGYAEDELAKELLTELAASGDNGKGYTLKQGIIRYKGRVWIGNNVVAHRDILIALHDSGIGGHSGISATYAK